MILPSAAHALVPVLALHFTSPTYQRFSTLPVGAVPTTGRRTVADLFRTLQHLAPSHRTDYPRVLSRAPWSGLALGCALMRFVLDHLVPDGPVVLVGGDTVDGHKGKHVYGKARHRDAVRSSHSYTAWRYGHKWVVLAVLVTFPFATRPRALPVLIDLYRSAEDGRARERPHRTPAQIMCGLLRLLLMRFPSVPPPLPRRSVWGPGRILSRIVRDAGPYTPKLRRRGDGDGRKTAKRSLPKSAMSKTQAPGASAFGGFLSF